MLEASGLSDWLADAAIPTTSVAAVSGMASFVSWYLRDSVLSFLAWLFRQPSIAVLPVANREPFVAVGAGIGSVLGFILFLYERYGDVPW